MNRSENRDLLVEQLDERIVPTVITGGGSGFTWSYNDVSHAATVQATQAGESLTVRSTIYGTLDVNVNNSSVTQRGGLDYDTGIALGTGLKVTVNLGNNANCYAANGLSDGQAQSMTILAGNASGEGIDTGHGAMRTLVQVGDGNDVIRMWGQNQTLVAGNGNDIVWFAGSGTKGNSNDTVVLGTGNDEVDFFNGSLKSTNLSVYHDSSAGNGCTYVGSQYYTDSAGLVDFLNYNTNYDPSIDMAKVS